jgi:hypothetical protein
MNNTSTKFVFRDSHDALVPNLASDFNLLLEDYARDHDDWPSQGGMTESWVVSLF